MNHTVNGVRDRDVHTFLSLLMHHDTCISGLGCAFVFDARCMNVVWCLEFALQRVHGIAAIRMANSAEVWVVGTECVGLCDMKSCMTGYVR